MQIKNVSIPEFLSGGGEAGEIIRTKDWSETSLGDPENWPQSLKTCIRIILTSSQPMFVWWGNELINIYNDAYKTILGGKHPWAFGKPASEVWKEIWNEVGPRAEMVMTQNIGTYDEALLLIMERNGYPEETYYTFSYSPIPGDKGGVGGIICANTDNTDLIINERSIQTLRELASLSYNETTVESVYKNATEVLHKNQKDFPFAIFFKIDKDSTTATAVAWAGDKKDYTDFPLFAELNKPTGGTRNLIRAVESGQVTLVKNEGRRNNIPKGFWDIIPTEFLHIPIHHPNKNKPLAVLTVGLNPYRQFNDVYRNFVKLVADQISLVVNNVLAYEEERKRRTALEEIDKAKTHFFSNISHEFRTPLTLILGPLENLLNNADSTFSASETNNLKSAHRSTLRLLRLVNMLLEFSRIEAGRIEGHYQPVDLAEYTADLAGAFRSTIEQAGLVFKVNLNKINKPVYVDREMWEKIVLNLISNAFKYTLAGEIEVVLIQEEDECVLKVKDTGIGIPEKELPKMFERFHRVQNAQGRSYEGTGIGLSLVYELVKLHGGTISLESKEGSGSKFTVRIPLGNSHLPAQNIIEESSSYLTSSLINTLIQETSDSVESKADSGGFNKDPKNKKIKILVVDDNDDMRSYIQNLLAEDYLVETATNGKDALEKISKEKPYLILSDIMMPIMDGNQLLQNLKQSPATSQIPVIFLSARAGDEAKTEGLEAGADDYLVKPFSSKEILARVKAQIKLLQTRSHVSNQIYNLFIQAPIALCIFKGKEMVIEIANEKMLELWGKKSDIINKTVLEALPEIKGQGFDVLLDRVYSTGERFVSNESPATLIRNGKEENIFVKFVFEALHDEEGVITGVMAIADEVTQQVAAKKALEEIIDKRTKSLRLKNKELKDSEEKYHRMTEEIQDYAILLLDKEGTILNWNSGARKIKGYTEEEAIGKNFRIFYLPEDLESYLPEKLISVAVETGRAASEGWRIRKDGTTFWANVVITALHDEKGNVIGFSKVTRDLTERKIAEDTSKNYMLELEKQNAELEQFAYVSSHDLQEPLRKIRTFSDLLLGQFPEGDHKNYLQKINSSAERMSNLIKDLLNYSRLNKEGEQFIPVNLNNILENVKTDLEVVIGQKKAVILSDSLPVIKGIPLQFNQLFLNLISNSLKFNTGEPLIKIKVQQAPLYETVAAKLDNKWSYLKLTFSDNGIGFEPEYSEQIFTIFQRLNTQQKFSGTGIGLAMCKKIIDNHNGYIRASGQPGEGATFTIFLPIR